MYIVFDVGGTNTRLAVSRDHDTFEEPVIVPTAALFDDAIEQFRNLTRELSGGEHIEAIAGGIRGPLNRDKTTLLSDIYLTDWVGRPIKEALANACAAPVYLENDANLVGLGEAHVGGGQGGRIVAYITVSTGIGGVRIVEGSIDQASVGFEPGKQIIDMDKSMCPDCSGNTFEEYVSGGGVEKRFGRPPYKIIENQTWHELSDMFATGLYNTIVHWSPDVMVLGGPMVVGDPAFFFEDIEKRVRELLTVFPEPPRIVKATLGDFGGLHGALVYLKQQLHQ